MESWLDKPDNYAERLAAIVKTAVDAIITIDEHGLIESVNPATQRLFGYDPGEIRGKNISILMPNPYAAEHDTYMHNYLTTGVRKIIGVGREVVAKRKDGTTFPIHLAISEVKLSGERFFTGIVRDISDRIEAERKIQEDRAKLVHAEKMAALGEMAAGIAHELGTPIATIRGRMELLEHQLNKQSVDKESIIKVAHTIRNEADRMTRIIRGILSFSRDGSKDPFRKEALKTLLMDVLEYSTERFRRHGIEVILGEVDENLCAECRATQIAQAMVNLLNNACDAVRALPERWIRIDAKDCGDIVELSVTDSGTGIPEKIRQRILEPFFTTKPAGVGTGLGLSISRSISQAHRGSLRIDTEHPNTRFVIAIPKHQKMVSEPQAKT